jgi:hypothetical protein
VRALRLRKKWSAAVAGVLVIGTIASVALGSPGLGFNPSTLVTASLPNKIELNVDGVKFRTKGPSDLRVQKIVIDPGGYSGWHHHPGIVIVSVASGAVTITQLDCSSKTYGPGLPDGSAFIEGGDGPVQASTVGGATAYATYVAPHAVPPVFRIEDAVPPPCTPNADSEGDGDGESHGGGDH